MEIPKTSKAAVLYEYGKPLELQEVTIPPIDGGEVLVKVLLAGICGTGLHQVEGTLGIKFPLPQILGHETLGQIISLSPQRTHDIAGRPLMVGDRIMWSHDFCGSCYYCAVKRAPSMCKNNHGYGFSHVEQLMGGFSEYERILASTDIVKVPDNVTDEEAIGVGCAFRTVVNAFSKLQRCSPLKLSDTVVVQGSGPVGMYSLLMAVNSGAGMVIVVGGPGSRLLLAKQWGAAHVIDIFVLCEPEERLAAILELNGGRGADLVIECTGVPAAFNEGCDILDRGGTYLVIGQTTTKSIDFVPNKIVGKNLTVLGSGSADILHYYRALEFISKNRKKFPMALLITKKYKLEEVNEAIWSMRQGDDMKVVLDLR
jgi:threonine dehydrogenase-like Zn-dependent dehydrogenase